VAVSREVFLESILRVLNYQPGRLAKGTLAMTAGMGLRTLGQAAVFLIVARVLGVTDYGAYSAVLALATALGGLSGMGVPIVMLRETARETNAFGQNWARALAALLLTVPVLFAIYTMLARLMLANRIGWFPIFCIGAAEICFAPLTFVTIQAYQGHERIGRAAYVLSFAIIPRFFMAIILPLVLFLPLTIHLSIWTLMYMIAAGISSCYCLWLIRRDLGVGINVCWSGLRWAFREGCAFSFIGAAQKGLADIDKTMLARLSTLEMAGIYSAGYRIVDMAILPLESFFSAAAPRFFRAGQSGMDGASQYVCKVIPLPLAFSLVGGVMLYLLADFLSSLLGTDFQHASGTIRWLAWLPCTRTARYFLQTMISVADRQYSATGILISGAALNIILNLWFIPLGGWQGCILATYISEVFIILIVLISVFRSRRHDP